MRKKRKERKKFIVFSSQREKKFASTCHAPFEKQKGDKEKEKHLQGARTPKKTLSYFTEIGYVFMRFYPRIRKPFSPSRFLFRKNNINNKTFLFSFFFSSRRRFHKTQKFIHHS
jgi:hypothetical protein